jgi:hypothetical protein
MGILESLCAFVIARNATNNARDRVRIFLVCPHIFSRSVPRVGVEVFSIPRNSRP